MPMGISNTIDDNSNVNMLHCNEGCFKTQQHNEIRPDTYLLII